MRGRRLADMTGTPSMTTFPQGTWAPWTATIGTPARPGSGQDLGGYVIRPRDRITIDARTVARQMARWKVEVRSSMSVDL